MRYGDGDYLLVAIAPGDSELGVEKAVAGRIGLAVGSFFIQNANGDTSPFRGDLTGDWDARPLPERAADSSAVAIAAELRRPGISDSALRLISTPVSKATSGQLGAALSGRCLASRVRRSDASAVRFAMYNWSPHGFELTEPAAAAGSSPARGAFPSLVEHFESQRPRALRNVAVLRNVESAALLYEYEDSNTRTLRTMTGHPDAAFVLPDSNFEAGVDRFFPST